MWKFGKLASFIQMWFRMKRHFQRLKAWPLIVMKEFVETQRKLSISSQFQLRTNNVSKRFTKIVLIVILSGYGSAVLRIEAIEIIETTKCDENITQVLERGKPWFANSINIKKMMCVSLELIVKLFVLQIVIVIFCI